MAKSLEPLELGVMFWADGDPAETLAELNRLGVCSGQLGIPGNLELNDPAAWKNFNIYTVFAAFEGESYADIPTVRRTVGFVPPATRKAREARMLQVSDFAAAIEAPGIATHIGFLTEDSGEIRDLVRRVCDHAAAHGQTFALETGQETAPALLEFISDVNRPNLGINFDPANMIWYGTGDPIEALEILAPYVLSVHVKDAVFGEERPLGEGDVGIGSFLAALKRLGYEGPLAIEREAADPAQRMRDIENGLALLGHAHFRRVGLC
jgi:sugar phosphate isomerase/epimerase